MRAALISCFLFATFGALADDSPMAVVAHERSPAWLIEVPDSITDILIAETDAATMRRFARAGDRIIEVDQRYMSIGLNGAGKQRAWDKRTPLGVYFVTESLDTSKLHEKYGVAAFPLDYPNAWDRLNDRTGYGIWLHGVDAGNPDRPPLDTDGCLSVPNEELLKLVARIEPTVTPVIVAPQMEWSLPEDIEALRVELRMALDQWRTSLEDGDILAYLALYDDAFRYRDMDRAEWSSYRFNVFEARQLDKVELDEVMLVADPVEPNLYLSRFRQVLTTVDGTVTTTRRLYWKRNEGSGWKIVSEDAG